jgi:hypothetical protein
MGMKEEHELVDDEKTLPTLNQSTQKGRKQGTKWKDSSPRRQMKSPKRGEPLKRGKAQGEHQARKPPQVTRSISNKEREGPLERMPSLNKLSTTTTIRLKIKTTIHPSIHPSYVEVEIFTMGNVPYILIVDNGQRSS